MVQTAFVWVSPLLALGVSASLWWGTAPWSKLAKRALAGVLLGLFSQTLDSLFLPHFLSNLSFGRIVLFYALQPDFAYGAIAFFLLWLHLRKSDVTALGAALVLLCGFYQGRSIWDAMIQEWRGMYVFPWASMVGLLLLLLIGSPSKGRFLSLRMLLFPVIPFVSALAFVSDTYRWLDQIFLTIASIALIAYHLRRSKNV